MCSAYILFLNPLILSGAASGFNTGMPKQDIVLATAISTAVATATMGLAANFPWVVSVQLGTNSFFVSSVLGVKECGAHATMQGPDKTCSMPCSCVPASPGNATLVPDAILSGACAADTPNTCMGTAIPYEQALAATFLEGLVFMLICFTGLRSVIIKAFPKSVLMAGAAGIGVFIAFVGMKDSGFIVAQPFPTLLGLNVDVPYKHGGWGAPGYHSGVGFNSCAMYMDGPPYSCVCPWLAVGGLLFTAILMIWNVNGAMIMGIFFTMFISWIKFPAKQSAGGLVPDKIIDVARFTSTAGALDFHWGENAGTLVGAFFMFLYLDLIGSSITFVSLGQMAGVLNDSGDMPRSNIAFLADAFGTTLGGLLGSSALTTYVESASAMREGGRTGFTAIVCSAFFLASIALWPLFSSIPAIATGPILCLIGAMIFMESIMEIEWTDMTDALPAFTTIIAMPFTHNIAYGVIAGLIMHVVAKAFSYQLCAAQQRWPGVAVYKRWSSYSPMFTSIPGWNVDAEGNRLASVSEEDQDLSIITIVKAMRKRRAAKAAGMAAGAGAGACAGASGGGAAPGGGKPPAPSGVPRGGDDSAHPVPAARPFTPTRRLLAHEASERPRNPPAARAAPAAQREQRQQRRLAMRRRRAVALVLGLLALLAASAEPAASEPAVGSGATGAGQQARAAAAHPDAADADARLRAALAHAEAAAEAAEADLLALAAIASVSALPAHAADVGRAAAWLASKLDAAGLDNVAVLPTEGPETSHPAVYADWLHAGAGQPTVLIYGHFDVQPADPLELWASPPFEPEVRAVGGGGERYFYGRGVDDDKGGLLQAVHALEAHLAATGVLPLNVKLLLEGQEEIGSPNLAAFLAKHRDGLLAGVDLALSADGGQVGPATPGITTGLRGAVALEVDVTTAGADLHSGVKGGSVANANHVLAALLAGLRDGGGRVTVPGFYDDVAPLSAEDRAAIAAFPFDAEAEAAALGVKGFTGEAGFGTLERRWLRPTLEVVGMWGGFTGKGMKTVIPRAAHAKISCRLVPHQRPEDVAALVRDHLLASAPPLANVSARIAGFRADPWTSPRGAPGNAIAARVLEEVMGAPPVFYRDGGTIPALAYFKSILGVDSTVFAFGLGDHIHAPNERLLASMFHTGRAAWVRYLAALGHDLGPALRAARATGGGDRGGAGSKDEL
ncbi:AZG1 [Scenedesmus sp. PABB004]|nr:AZG1 [Scenedesmus sp. PABB004]